MTEIFRCKVGNSTNGIGLESCYGLSLENERETAAPCPKESTSGVRVKVRCGSHTPHRVKNEDGGEREATVGRRRNNVAKAVILRQHQIRSDLAPALDPGYHVVHCTEYSRRVLQTGIWRANYRYPSSPYRACRVRIAKQTCMEWKIGFLTAYSSCTAPEEGQSPDNMLYWVGLVSGATASTQGLHSIVSISRAILWNAKSTF